MTSSWQASSLDSYARRARLAPALLVVLPAVMATIAWLPPEVTKATGVLVVAVLIASGGMVLLAEVARDAGKRKQDDLFREWGGSPAVTRLRHRDPASSALTKGRVHRALGRSVPDIQMPTEADEMQRPTAADAVYESCIDFLREQTRDRGRFPLVAEENASYGFRRNLWAMKPAGLLISILALAACGVAIAWRIEPDSAVPIIPTVMLTAVAMMTAFWLVRVTKTWVRAAADSYAERLLGACEALVSQEGKAG